MNPGVIEWPLASTRSNGSPRRPRWAKHGGVTAPRPRADARRDLSHTCGAWHRREPTVNPSRLALVFGPAARRRRIHETARDETRATATARAVDGRGGCTPARAARNQCLPAVVRSSCVHAPVHDYVMGTRRSPTKARAGGCSAPGSAIRQLLPLLPLPRTTASFGAATRRPPYHSSATACGRARGSHPTFDCWRGISRTFPQLEGSLHVHRWRDDRHLQRFCVPSARARGRAAYAVATRPWGGRPASAPRRLDLLHDRTRAHPVELCAAGSLPAAATRYALIQPRATRRPRRRVPASAARFSRPAGSRGLDADHRLSYTSVRQLRLSTATRTAATLAWPDRPPVLHRLRQPGAVYLYSLCWRCDLPPSYPGGVRDRRLIFAATAAT